MIHKIYVPFPPPELNPNRRAYKAERNALKREYFDQCFEAAQAVTPVFETIGRIPLKMVFHPPNNQQDWDNLVASMKGGIDGIAKAWGVNDKRFRPIVIDFAESDKHRPRVEISIKADG